MIEHIAMLHTDGEGYWSEVSKDVRILGFEIRALEYEQGAGMRRFGELRVLFDTTGWDIYEDGLIYTDKLFAKELDAVFAKKGMDARAHYSEQGMQGRDYVSLDVGEEFITQFDKAFGHSTFYETCGE